MDIAGFCPIATIYLRFFVIRKSSKHSAKRGNANDLNSAKKNKTQSKAFLPKLHLQAWGLCDMDIIVNNMRKCFPSTPREHTLIKHSGNTHAPAHC